MEISPKITPQSVQLPELLLGPIKYDIGIVFKLLRKTSTHNIIRKGKVKISPRKSEKFIVFDNGESIIITKNKKLNLPTGIEGILREISHNKYEWITHRKIESEKQKLINNSNYPDEIANSWKDQLRYKAEQDTIKSSSDYGLRPPQLGALFSIGSHWSLSNSPATIVMPTGTGKTEVMIAISVAHHIKRSVIAVPSKALKFQIATKFKSLGILNELGVIPKDIEYPIVGIINKRPKSESELKIFNDCNIVIGAISSLSGGTASIFLNRIAEKSDVLFVDEAHHLAALTWQNLKSAFKSKRVVQFTATPFRNDGKLVGGTVIYSYPIQRAQEAGYFKKIDFIPVYELDDNSADLIIAQKAIKKLRDDLKNGLDHQLMARCRTKERANEIHKIYLRIASDLSPVLIHSEIKESDERINKLRTKKSKIVICVNMLGEGVDIPSLKVAAIHDMHQSLAVLLQFIGRFTRTGNQNIGDASVIANIANPNISQALDRLYNEDANWNLILRELSSSAAKEHAEFIKFLDESTPFEIKGGDGTDISQNSLKPIFSSLFYICDNFFPKKFISSIPKGSKIIRIWINDKSNTLYFVTKRIESVKWSNSKQVDNVEWNLFVLHHNPQLKLLYLASTNKSSNHESLAKAVGATVQIEGESIFRSLSGIGRLVFNNLGITKHGRRNLSFAMYTGADVKQALSETEKKGSRKSNISGYGWQNGKQITIGCSFKGRVWSKASGTIPQFIKWADIIGKKLLDESIETKDVISNVLIPEFVKEFPDFEILNIDWPFELFSYSEDRIIISNNSGEYNFYMTDIQHIKIDNSNLTIDFSIIVGSIQNPIAKFRMLIKGESGWEIEEIDGTSNTLIKIGNNENSLIDFFRKYPPLIRFMDLSELDGNIILKSEDAGTVVIPNGRLVVWDWKNVDITKESIWKNGKVRKDSIQWEVAQKFINKGFSLVYDDDDTGEAADLICIKEESDIIKLVLIHCKFSGDSKTGKRVKDIVEVSSQAVRSARWPGKPKELIKHIKIREKRHLNNPNRSGFLAGDSGLLNSLQKSIRFKEIKPEIVIVQPGLSKSKLTRGQSVILGATDSYLKQTVNIDLVVLCSE
ncbi:MAG: DEAD/DEAH box helicase family protein [Cytophagales bacterium]|nr:DEAD/DEAH box helicase family protein [Cytophagales bacterium]